MLSYPATAPSAAQSAYACVHVCMCAPGCRCCMPYGQMEQVHLRCVSVAAPQRLYTNALWPKEASNQSTQARAQGSTKSQIFPLVCAERWTARCLSTNVIEAQGMRLGARGRAGDSLPSHHKANPLDIRSVQRWRVWLWTASVCWLESIPGKKH